MTTYSEGAWEASEYVVALLQSAGFEGYLVGGAVRDILLGRTPKDFDVVTNATPDQVMAIAKFERTSYTDPAQAFGVTRVRVSVNGSSYDVEVATYRRDIEAHLGRKLTKVEFTHIEDDLERRDLTINALALDLGNDFLVDLHDGLGDLEHGIIRFIGDPSARIKEDPLRILRAVRFRNQLAFAYDAQTETALEEAVIRGALDDIAVDRARNELTLMLLHESRRSVLEDMYNLGIIERLLPELAACVAVPQPTDQHAEGDVWVHTLCTVDELPRQASTRLAWAAVLHDVGKAVTVRPPKDEHDRIHFDNHYRVGADIARSILSRLNFSKKLQDEVSWLVHYHLITDSFPDMKPSRRSHYMAHPAFADLIELHKADIRGSHSKQHSTEDGEADIAELERSWRHYLEESRHTELSLKKALGVDGHWLKREYGISEGTRMRVILDRLQGEYLDGTIQSVDDVRRIMTQLT